MFEAFAWHAWKERLATLRGHVCVESGMILAERSNDLSGSHVAIDGEHS